MLSLQYSCLVGQKSLFLLDYKCFVLESVTVIDSFDQDAAFPMHCSFLGS